MTYWTKRASPVGVLTLASDGESLLGLWLEGQKYDAAGLEPDAEGLEIPRDIYSAYFADCY